MMIPINHGHLQRLRRVVKFFSIVGQMDYQQINSYTKRIRPWKELFEAVKTELKPLVSDMSVWWSPEHASVLVNLVLWCHTLSEYSHKYLKQRYQRWTSLQLLFRQAEFILNQVIANLPLN